MLTKIDLSNFNFNEFNPFNLDFSTLPNDYKQLIINTASHYFNNPIPVINTSDYLEYTKIGNRTNFEELYFNRRRALGSLVLAECIEKEDKYLDKIVNLIIHICEESGWQLPAHNNYVRDTTPLPFPDITKPVLDLFSLETSALLTTTMYMLKTKLKKEYPFVIDRINLEILNRTITPYINEYFWWMGEEERTLNWTVWCTQNVLISVFLGNFDNTTRSKVANKSLKSLQAFLNDYHSDGCCDEGAEYYRHAGLCFFGAIDLLNNVTSDKFDFVFTSSKVKNIANYIKNVNVHDNYYINFADCAAIAGYCGTREYLFAKKINDTSLINFTLLQHSNTKAIDLPEEINLFYKTQSIITSVEMREKPINDNIDYKDLYYEGVGLFIARDDKLCLGVKAGCNNDNHNHNDTGSFTIYKNGVPFIIDVGVESYNAKTFSPNRYDIWTMQSSYHNLPDFDGKMQIVGEEFCATNVTTSFTDDYAKISMNIEKAYSDKCKLDKFIRNIQLNKNEHIIIEDTTTGNFKTSVLNLMFWKEPTIENNVIIVKDIGKIILSNSISTNVEKIKIEDARLEKTWKNFVYRLKIEYKENIKLIVK